MVVRKRMQFWVKMLVFTGVAFIAASFNGPGSLFAQDQDSELDKPVITSIVVEDDEVVIEVDVPAGVMKITLEYRNRLAKGTGWEVPFSSVFPDRPHWKCFVCGQMLLSPCRRRSTMGKVVFQGRRPPIR